MTASMARFMSALLGVLAVVTALLGWWGLAFVGCLMALLCLAESQR